MDIIPRYLDRSQDLTRAELDRLAVDLLGDRELALDFARAARLDHALEETLADEARTSDLGALVAMLEKPGAPPPGKTIPRAAVLTLATAAAVALCWNLALLWSRDRSDDPPSSADANPAEKRIQRPSVHLPQTRLTTMLQKDKRPDAEAETLMRQRLSRFYLPATNINDLPLDEALASLQQRLYDLDLLGWTDDEAVAFAVAETRSESDPLANVSLTRSNISVLSALKLLAIQSGHELAFSPPKITLVPRGADVAAAKADSDESLLRTYLVSSELLASGPYREWIPAIFSADGRGVTVADADGPIQIMNTETGEALGSGSFQVGRGKVGIDAWDADAITTVISSAGSLEIGIILPALDQESISERLRDSWGLKLAGDSHSGNHLPAASELVLNASAADHARFAALLAEADASKAMITISTELISLPSELAGSADRIVNLEEWDQIFRDWRQQPGVDLMGAPFFMGPIGTEMSLESMETRSVEVNQEDGENPGDIIADRRTGLRLPISTRATGEQIVVSGSIDQSFDEDTLSPAMLEDLGGSDPASPIIHFVTEIEAPLFPGQVAIFECEPHEPGRKMIAAVSVNWGALAPDPTE